MPRQQWALLRQVAATCVTLVMATTAFGGGLSMSVAASRRNYDDRNNALPVAAAGNGFPVVIYVLVTDPSTGAPVTDLTPGKQGEVLGTWTQDLDLPKTHWRFDQSVPDSAPRLRVLRIANQGSGLYRFDVLPVVGARGKMKTRSTWVKGDYVFEVGYSNSRADGSTVDGRVMSILSID